VIATDAEETNPTVSPDGRWLAYQSDRAEPGLSQIYVEPFPEVGSGRSQISVEGGTRPVWSPAGSELFYYVERDGSGAMMTVSYESGPTFEYSAPQVLFEGPYLPP